VTGAAPPVANLLDLTGRLALVIVGSGGIGAGIARRVAEAGAAVVVHYRGDPRGAHAVVESMERS
jgi:NAD(P)-dependent dehydrogenase (short-subunit alcohol dehydrogenase family)